MHIFGGKIKIFCNTNGFLTEFTCNSINTPTSRYGVIILALIIGVKEPFEPLEEFKVILETSFHQFVDWNNLKKKILFLFSNFTPGKGAFFNYVDKILASFDHLPPCVGLNW